MPHTWDPDRYLTYADERGRPFVELVARVDVESPRTVVDLGCGVGASLCYLAGLLPITGTGVTLSPVQVQAARERITSAGLSDRVTCIEGDGAPLDSAAVAALAPAGVELELEDGGQPSWWWLLAAE